MILIFHIFIILRLVTDDFIVQFEYFHLSMLLKVVHDLTGRRMKNELDCKINDYE